MEYLVNMKYLVTSDLWVTNYRILVTNICL